MMTVAFIIIFALAMFSDCDPYRDVMIIASGLFAIAAAIEMGVYKLSKK